MSPTHQNSLESVAWQFGLRDLLLFTAALAANLTACTAVLRGTEDANGVAAAQSIGAGITCVFLYWWASRRSGQLLVRLRRERQLSFWVREIFLAPLICVILAFALPAGKSYSGIRVGLVTFIVYSIAFNCWTIFANSIDLCERGIISHKLFFYSWPRLIRGHCGLNQNGNLEFGWCWYRTTAVVPPEQRAAVDALLKEKLRDQNAIEVGTEKPVE